MKKKLNLEDQESLANQNERTSFWKSLFYQSLFVFLPGLGLWFLVGANFQAWSFNQFVQLKAHQSAWSVLICLGYLLFVFMMTYGAWKLKWQKNDCFIFSLAIALAWTAIILNSLWLVTWQPQSRVLKSMVYFGLGLGAAFIGLILGTLVAAGFRNLTFKRELKLAKTTTETADSNNPQALV